MSEIRLTSQQKEAIMRYVSLSSFDFMRLDEIKEGKLTFKEAWDYNVTWLRHVYEDVQRINVDNL